MVTKKSTPAAGDVLIHEESAMVCRESTVVTNPAAVAFTAIVGQPLAADGSVILAAGEAATAGLLLQSVPLEANETTVLQYGMVARGPAAINVGKIALIDANGAGLNLAAIVTELETLGMVMRWEPDETSTQLN